MKNKDKFRGCLIGGAAGDALGYAVEFMNEPQIFGKYGKNGITEYSLVDGIAEISDDTQMTLFTAGGLISAVDRGNNSSQHNLSFFAEAIRRAYLEWYITQTKKYPVNASGSRLLNIAELFSLRAPGITCISAIQNGANGTMQKPVNQSKGCGGVMRVAPIGLFFSDTDVYDRNFSDTLGAMAAALTHGHELGYIPAAALVHIVRAVIENGGIPLKDAVTESISAMQSLFPKQQHINYFTKLMNKAAELACSDIDDLSAIHQLGEGWVAEETLAIAVYCALKHENNFDKAIIASVNHNGDSDSTGAVTGSILGAYLGYDAIPDKYKNNLELHDLIIEIADDIYYAL